MAEEEIHPLDRIVDDDEPHVQCLEYLCAQMLAGRLVDDLRDELIAAGWPEDDADDLAERARQQTRRARGVVTREDVARESRHNYRQGWYGGWMSVLMLPISVRRLIYAVRTLRQLKKRQRD